MTMTKSIDGAQLAKLKRGQLQAMRTRLVKERRQELASARRLGKVLTKIAAKVQWCNKATSRVPGATPITRGGLTIMANLALGELVAKDVDDYVDIAVGLARDIPRLTDLRTTLRQLLADSALMDGPHFARDMETAFRYMWHAWCATRNLSHPAGRAQVRAA
jgi:hypothetical protein